MASAPPGHDRGAQPSEELLRELAARLDRAAQRRLGRSLAIREVDAGSCNGCELEVNALNNAVYDLERFGIRFVASPRHADVLLVTGPVTLNMREALLRTWDCTPEPKWVVAVGDCAAGCGVFAGSPMLVGATGAVAAVLPVAPPHPRLPATADRSAARAAGAARDLAGAGPNRCRRRKPVPRSWPHAQAEIEAMPEAAVTPAVHRGRGARRGSSELAQAIAAALPPRFTLVGLLKGSFVFVADLARALSRAGCSAADRVHARLELRQRHHQLGHRQPDGRRAGRA